MKIVTRSVCLFVIVLTMACAKDKANEVIVPVDEKEMKEEVEEPKEVLDFVNVQTIAETPVSHFNSSFVYDDKIYATSEQETYMFDFNTKIWTLLTTDPDTPNTYFDLGLDFIRNGKWNRFTRKGLHVFDFELNEWEAVDAFSHGIQIFSTEGFYLEKEEAIYYVDQTNENDKIYKYDLKTNELIAHSTFENDGGWNGISKNTFVINNNYYIVNLSEWENMKISKFNNDFTKFETINEIQTENYLDAGIACQYGNYLIFGLGGTPDGDKEGNLTDNLATLKFYFYDISENTFTEMDSSFYESCTRAQLVTYKNEFYLINGYTVNNGKQDARNTIEKIEFDIVEK